MSFQHEQRNCSVCGQPIPEERLEALPNTQTCTAHSNAQAYRGFMIPTASKGCAPELSFIPQNNPEAQRLAERAHRRRR